MSEKNRQCLTCGAEIKDKKRQLYCKAHVPAAHSKCAKPECKRFVLASAPSQYCRQHRLCVSEGCKNKANGFYCSRHQLLAKFEISGEPLCYVTGCKNRSRYPMRHNTPCIDHWPMCPIHDCVNAASLFTSTKGKTPLCRRHYDDRAVPRKREGLIATD
jgi:hypothetical protein